MKAKDAAISIWKNNQPAAVSLSKELKKLVEIAATIDGGKKSENAYGKAMQLIAQLGGEYHG